MQPIILSTINARYIHASLGLRYLLANMGELREQTLLLEFTLEQRAEDIAETLLQRKPCIIGFGVYIWNVIPTTEVIRLIKIIDPSIKIVVGGPEVSFETQEQAITELADHVVTGQADVAFGELCSELLDSARTDIPGKLVSALPFKLNDLHPPYPYYNQDDLDNRVIYVEASRGCPFKCEFCLSSLDKTATPFTLEPFLQSLSELIVRGAKQFKFVDRTFNLKAETGRQILQFFLEHQDKNLFLHFELIPDRLPSALKELLPQFDAGRLQFEIGIQSFNPEVQKRISRRQDHAKTVANLSWLRAHTDAHIHADLIVGLPGENIVSFGKGFDLLYSLGPQEIQVGILKRLRGTPISRHIEEYDMRYMSVPPYRILSTQDMTFDEIQRMVRFARYWDLIANSGRFPATLPLLLQDKPFDRFLRFSDWLFAFTRQTHRISLERLFVLLWQGLGEGRARELCTAYKDRLYEALLADHQHNKLKGSLRLPEAALAHNKKSSGPAKRQNRHLAGST